MARVLAAVIVSLLVAPVATFAQDRPTLSPTAAERALVFERAQEDIGAGALSLARDETGRWAVAAREDADRLAAIERVRWRVQDQTAVSFSDAELEGSASAATVAGIAGLGGQAEVPPVALSASEGVGLN